MAERVGRPEIGPTVNVRLPQDLIDALDEMAEYHGLSRAATIRMILMAELEDPKGGYNGRAGYASRYVEKAKRND